MMQVKERMALYTALGMKLEETVKRTRDDVDTLKMLLADETESMEKALARMGSQELSESSRRAHETGIENRKHAIDVLEKVFSLFRSKETRKAGALLKTLGAKPGRKTTRTSGMWPYYQEYLMDSDTKFHAWLKKHGKTDVLQTLGKNV